VALRLFLRHLVHSSSYLSFANFTIAVELLNLQRSVCFKAGYSFLFFWILQLTFTITLLQWLRKNAGIEFSFIVPVWKQLAEMMDSMNSGHAKVVFGTAQILDALGSSLQFETPEPLNSLISKFSGKPASLSCSI